MSYSENFVSYEAISVSNNSHCATYLLHTNKTSSKGRSFISTKVKHLPSRSKDLQSNGMASINRNFKNKGGFSKETRKLLTASWMKGNRLTRIVNSENSVVGIQTE